MLLKHIFLVNILFSLSLVNDNFLNTAMEANVKNFMQQDKKIESELMKSFTGTWKKDISDEDCWAPNCIKIQFGKANSSFTVESNQICVSAYFKLDPLTETVQLFYKGTTDLGVGGASLPWKNFDQSKPLAVISFNNSQKTEIKIKWLGFYNTKRPNEKMQFGSGYDGVFYKVPNNK